MTTKREAANRQIQEALERLTARLAEGRSAELVEYLRCAALAQHLGAGVVPIRTLPFAPGDGEVERGQVMAVKMVREIGGREAKTRVLDLHLSR